jgi:signal transduction histidine kinase
MNIKKTPAGLVLLCDDRGMIRQVNRDDFGLGELNIGTMLGLLVDPGSRTKLLNFLVEVRSRGSATGWEVNFIAHGQIISLCLAGVTDKESMLLIGTQQMNEAELICAGLVEIHPELANTLLTTIQEHSFPDSIQKRDENNNFEDVTLLNSELIDLQRKLVKNNLELQKAMQELKRSNSELETFAYVASHDLQEPLRMITSYLQLLEQRYKGRLDKDALEFIAYAVDGSNRMKQLIDGLLSYSRVGTRGKEFASTDCESVLNQVLYNLQFAIEENEAEITHDPLPNVMADDTQLAQLFQNLVSNAIKFHGLKTPRVHVRAMKKGNEWIFSVKDNGIGIEPEFFEQIFVIFRRLESREKFAGSGIGLAVCKRIVERHGGRIWLESQPGEGTNFFFSLPGS